jgi:hypothetical protein
MQGTDDGAKSRPFLLISFGFRPTRWPGIWCGGTVAEIRDLAKKWQNCLADYLYNINDGTSAIYLSKELKAVCSVGRHGRMGWFLLQTKGPRNAAIDPDQLEEIYDAFGNAGVPPASMIEAIKSIVLTDEWSRHRHIPDDDEIFDEIEAY